MSKKPNCSECIRGSIHQGEPKGTIEPIHGLNTYVVGQRTNPRGIIVMYSDVFGFNLINNKLIADAYASSGEYLVYMPDFFQGDALGLKIADVLLPVDATKQSTFSKYTGMLASLPTFVLWMARHKAVNEDRICVDFLTRLRRGTPASQNIGMVGFCWGGKYTLRAARECNIIDVNGEKKPLVDAVVALHPSNLTLPEDVDKPVVPMSVGWGVEDQGVSFAQKAQVEDIHDKSRKAGVKIPETEHQVYRPGRHGFAVRGNPDDPQERKALEDSEKQVLDWMKKWL